nr:Dabb family protein [Sodalis glossinidius]
MAPWTGRRDIPFRACRSPRIGTTTWSSFAPTTKAGCRRVHDRAQRLSAIPSRCFKRNDSVSSAGAVGIPGIKNARWHENRSRVQRYKGFRHMLALWFDDRAALEVYMAHPHHHSVSADVLLPALAQGGESR